MNALTAPQVKEIAARLDSHERCFIDPITGEVAFWLNFDSGDFDEKEYFSSIGGEEGKVEKARYKKALKTWKEIEPLDSREDYAVMEAFVESLSDSAVQDRLWKALRSSKPFAKFRYEIDNAGKFRQQWFDFQLQQNIIAVQAQLRMYKIEFEAVAKTTSQETSVDTEKPPIPSHIQVQRLGRNDAEALRALTFLFQEVFENETPPTASLSYLSKLLFSEMLVVYNVYCDNELAGGLTAYVLHCYRNQEKELFLYDIAVRQKYQRQGLGMKLLRALQNYAKKNGFRAVFVAADVEDQHALDFYRAAGGVASDVQHFTFQTSF